MFRVGDVVRPYHPLSVHMARPPTAIAQINAHVADAVAAPSPSANETPRVKRSQAQLSNIGKKMIPTKGQPVPNTHNIEAVICTAIDRAGWGWTNIIHELCKADIYKHRMGARDYTARAEKVRQRSSTWKYKRGSSGSKASAGCLIKQNNNLRAM